MWMIPTNLLCRQHLLGEHGEIHKHRHNFIKKHNMNGRRYQIFPLLMKSRHDELALELIRRGYQHKSPYTQPDVSYLDIEMLAIQPNIEANIKHLCNRCEECRVLINAGVAGVAEG